MTSGERERFFIFFIFMRNYVFRNVGNCGGKVGSCGGNVDSCGREGW